MSLLLLLAAQAAALTPAEPPADPTAGSWRTMGDTADVVMAVDDSATRRSGDLVLVRIRGDLSSQPEGPRWLIIDVELDCQAHAPTVLALHAYGADGRLLESQRRRGLFELGNQPGSNGRVFVDETCAGAGADGGAQ